jgi:tRNA dimethylallyltransferase
LFGPTGVGKTDVVFELFRLSGEIVSADSMQVYRGMDIGTAKPEQEEREQLPHHLIDCRTPREQFHAGDFVTACDQLIPQIRERGKVPVIAGGTAFYLRCYLFGLPGTPQTPPEIRAALRQHLKEAGPEKLHRELQRVDPIGAQEIAPHDGYRIIRALEVYRTTGRPRSDFRVPSTVRSGIDVLIVGLHRDRTELYERINRRVEAMFRAGLVDEVSRLLSEGYRFDDPGMQAIGYREFAELGIPPWSEESLAVVRERIQRNTRRYAKRQITFFRSLPDVKWIHADDRSALKELLRTVGAP